MNAKEQILTKILKCRSIDLYTKEREMNEVERLQAQKMIGRFESGEPLQYILGEVAFCDCVLKVNKHVLIPRFETEILMEHMLHTLKDSGEITILDLGTGSGNISIALAKALPQARILALDISQKAVQLAIENARINQVEDRITFIIDDMRVYLDKMSGEVPAFDCIVSNPPYISTNALAHLPTDVRQEPLEALDGGGDGCLFYHAIIQHLKAWLKKGGYCFFEIGETQAAEIQSIFDRNSLIWTTDVFKDYTEVNRIFKAQRMS